jgi:carbon storage regulator
VRPSLEAKVFYPTGSARIDPPGTGIPFEKEHEMLVLTRKEGEQIVVGDNIRITVLSIRGNRVRLGLLAPPDVSILRQELEPRDSPAAVGALSSAPQRLAK